MAAGGIPGGTAPAVGAALAAAAGAPFALAPGPAPWFRTGETLLWRCILG